MTQIWKYPIEISDVQHVTMPPGAVDLSVQMQHGRPCIWAEVDSDTTEQELRRFVMYGTGQSMRQDHGRFIGTFQTNAGAFVFHLYERKR